jgi:hypothetical protein
MKKLCYEEVERSMTEKMHVMLCAVAGGNVGAAALLAPAANNNNNNNNNNAAVVPVPVANNNNNNNNNNAGAIYNRVCSSHPSYRRKEATKLCLCCLLSLLSTFSCDSSCGALCILWDNTPSVLASFQVFGQTFRFG